MSFSASVCTQDVSAHSANVPSMTSTHRPKILIASSVPALLRLRAASMFGRPMSTLCANRTVESRSLFGREKGATEQHHIRAPWMMPS